MDQIAEPFALVIASLAINIGPAANLTLSRGLALLWIEMWPIFHDGLQASQRERGLANASESEPMSARASERVRSQ